MVWTRIPSLFTIHKIPGWIFTLWFIVRWIFNNVPDWYGRIDFWIQRAAQLPNMVGAIASIVAWRWFDISLFFLGVLYLLFVGESKHARRHPLLPILGGGIVGVVVIAFCFVLFAGHVVAPFQQEVAEIRKKLDCYIGSWRLTPDQMTTIATYLKEHKPYEVTVKWTSFERRAGRYAEDLSEAFRKGDWLVSSDPGQERLPSGVTVFYRSNEATQKANKNRRRSAPPNPGEVMQGALQGAGLQGSNVPNYSPDPDPQLADHEYKVSVMIGEGPYSQGCEESEENKV